MTAPPNIAQMEWEIRDEDLTRSELIEQARPEFHGCSSGCGRVAHPASLPIIPLTHAGSTYLVAQADAYTIPERA